MIDSHSAHDISCSTPPAFQELRQTLAGIANAEAAASALPRRWELVPCEPGWHTQEEEAQKAHLRDRLAAAGLCKRF